VTIFIADYYNAFVRAVGPDAIIRNVAGEGRVVLGLPIAPSPSSRGAAGCTSPIRATTGSSRWTSRRSRRGPLVAPRPLAPVPVKKAR
jgi:hypothetical protein